jgi:hypothetical protein
LRVVSWWILHRLIPVTLAVYVSETP